MQSGQNITLDFVLKNNIKITAKQNDINSRYLNITLKNNGQDVILTDTSTAILNITRSDRQRNSYMATIENSLVIALLPEWAVKFDGILNCDISIIENNERLTTMPFKVEVIRACCTSEDIQDTESTDVLTYLLDKVKDVDTIMEDVLENTSVISELSSDVSENTQSIAELKRKRDTITLTASNWVLNSNTNLYEYTVTDTDVTANHYIDCIMDLANQDKMEDGYVESFTGSYKFYTSTLPTEDITVTVVISLTEEVE